MSSFRLPWWRWTMLVGAMVAIGAGFRPAYLSVETTVIVHRAEEHVRNLQYSSAIRLFQQAISISPRRADLHYRLAVIARTGGEPAIYLKHLEEARKLGYPLGELRRQRMLFKVQSNRLDPSSEEGRDFENYIARPDLHEDAVREIYEARALSFMTSFQLPKALETLNFWLEWRPDDIRALMWRADVLERVNRNSEARADYERILAVAPGCSLAVARLGNVLLESNDPAAALKLVEETPLPEDETARELLFVLAEALQRLGRANEAAKAYDELLLTEMPALNRLELLLRAGELSRELNDVETAEERFRAAVELDPFEPKAHMRLAGVLDRKGDKEGAKKHREAYDRLQKVANRVSEISLALATDPRNTALRVEAGDLMFAQGILDGGAGWYRTAVDIDPLCAEAHEGLQKYFQAKNDRVNANYHATEARKAREAAAKQKKSKPENAKQPDAEDNASPSASQNGEKPSNESPES